MTLEEILNKTNDLIVKEYITQAYLVGQLDAIKVQQSIDRIKLDKQAKSNRLKH